MSGRNYYQNQYEGNGREDENVVKFGVDKSEDRLKRAEMKEQIDALFASHYGPGAQNSQAQETQNCQAQDPGHSRGAQNYQGQGLNYQGQGLNYQDQRLKQFRTIKPLKHTSVTIQLQQYH